MATAALVTTDLTTCPICLDVFDNPKSLPCLHAFCLKCLEHYFKDKRSRDKVVCPLCRKEFQIPSDGLCGLQHHFFVQQLVDVRKVSGEEFGEVPCVVCLDESDGISEEIPPATVYCVDCKQKLCERCSRPHRRWAGGAHQLKPLGDEVQQELIQLRSGSCDKHKDEQVKLYCHQCNENSCLMCFAVKHQQHKSGEIPEVAQVFRERIEADDRQILSAISTIRQMLEQNKQGVNKFLTDVDCAKKTVHQTGDEMKHLADNQISDLVSELQSVKSDSAKQAQAVKDQLQQALVAMESFHTYSQELLDKGRPSDVTRAACELHNRATELLKNDVTTLKFCPPHVTFIPADVMQLTRLKLVGIVTVGSGNELGMEYLKKCFYIYNTFYFSYKCLQFNFYCYYRISSVVEVYLVVSTT